jgi:hypothetical protein
MGFFEATLHVKTFRNDYRKEQLTAERAGLRRLMTKLRGEVAALEAQERIRAQAPDLGLVAPDPNQIEVIMLSTAEQTQQEYMLRSLLQSPMALPMAGEAPRDVPDAFQEFVFRVWEWSGDAGGGN